MSILDLDPEDPNNWYQSPHLGLFPVSPAGYGGGISAACYCTHSSHPHGSPSYPPPPSQTIINGYVFPHQFPSTHNYHSPHSDPNPWIYPSISQHHSYGPSVSSVHSPFIFTKTMTTPPIYHFAPSIQTFQSPLVPTFMPQLPITYPKPLSLNRKSFRRFRHRVAMAAKERIAKKTRNPYMFHGVGKYSRSKMYHKRGLWAIKAKNGGAFPHHNSKEAGEIMEELGQLRVGRKTLIDTSEPPAVQSGTPPTTGNTSSFSFPVTEPTDHSISTQASAGSSLPPSNEATGFVGDISLDIPAVAVNLAGINESAHDVDPNASTGSQIVTEINVGVQISEDVLLPEYVLPAEVSVNTENGHNWIEMVIDLEKLGVLDIGPPVVEALSRTKFIGLSKGFSFLNGLSHSSTFQIVNVISTGENVMGYWTPENEFVRNLNCKTAMNSSFSTSNSSLGSIIWPGDSTSTPKGWQIPTSGTKLKILLPVQSGFKEFTNVADDSNFEQHIMMKEEFYKEQLTLVYRFCRSGHFDKAKEVFVQILKRWKSKVTDEVAGEENTKKPNFVLKEGLKLDNKMVVCSIDTQSRSHLLSWFILFFELGNCETMKETPPYCRKASAEISLVTQSLVSQVFTAIISSPQYFRASFYGVLYDLIKLYVVIYIAFIDNAGNFLPDDSFGIMIGNDKLFYEYMNVLAKMLLRSVSKEQLMSSNVSIMDTIVAALCGESIKMDGVGISFLIWLLAIRSTKFKREAASIIHIWASLIDYQMVDWNVIYALMYEERFIIKFSKKRKDRELEALKCVSLVIEVHGSAMRRGLSNLVLRNAVVNVYGHRGYKVHAYQMFKLIESKDVVSWTSMISCYVHNGPASEALELCQLMKEVNVKLDFQAYGMHGHGKEAIDLFKRMEDQKIVPDHIMFWAQVFYIKGQMETDDGLANQLGKICLLIAIAINQFHLNEAAALYKGMDTSAIIQLHSTNWLVQPEHEHCKWSAAIFLALISSCLHVTNHKQKFENIARLVEVLCSSKSIFVKGAGGIGLGFSCQDLLTWANASDNSSMETDLDKLLERDLLGDIAKALLFMIFWVRGLDAISKIKDVISWVLHMNGMVQVSFHHLLQLVITLFIFYLELFSGVVSSIICNSHYGSTFSYICYLVGNLSHKCQAAQLQNQRQKQNNALGENERSLLLFQRVLFLCFISELAKGDRQLQIFLPYVIMLELGEAFTTWELLHTRGGCSDRECPGVLTETNRCEDVVVFKDTDVGGDQSKLHAHNLSPMSYESDSRHAVELGNGASLLLLYFFCNYHINARGHQLGAEMISSDVPLLSVDDLANQLVEVLDLYRLKEVLSLGGDLDDEAGVSFGRQLRLEVKPVL